MPGRRMARILALGLALTTVGCSALARPSAPAASYAAHPVDTLRTGTPGFGATAPPTTGTTPSPVPATDAAMTPRPSLGGSQTMEASHADPALEALLPERASERWYAESWAGQDVTCCRELGMIVLPGPPDAYARVVDRSLDQMTVALGGWSGRMGHTIWIRALRVRGAPQSKLVDAWLALLDAEQSLPAGTSIPTPPTVPTPRPAGGFPITEEATIGGKHITTVLVEPGAEAYTSAEFLYTYGDVLFVVTDANQPEWALTTEPTPDVVEAIAALP